MKWPKVTLAFLVVLAGLVAGCSAVTPTVAPATGTGAEQSPGINWHQLAGQWPGPGLQRAQVVAITDRQGQRSFHVLYEVELRADHLVIFAMTPLGVPVYRVQMVNGRYDAESYLGELAGMPLDTVLEDLVLSSWPLPALQAAAAAAGHNIEQTGDMRRLHGPLGELLVEVRYTGQGINIIHHDLPLEIFVQGGTAAEGVAGQQGSRAP